jgi:hypothetical protein
MAVLKPGAEVPVVQREVGSRRELGSAEEREGV